MRRRHKLLLVVNRLTPAGGAEAQLATLVKGLAALGHEVTLCCIDNSTVDPDSFEDGNVEVVQLHVRSRYGRAFALPRLIALARKADVVHCTMWDPSLWGRIAAIVARRPVVVADHATDRSVQVAASGAPRASWIAAHNRLLDRFTFATIACATSQRPVLISEGVHPEKIVHIPNGVPVAEMVAAAASGPTRAEIGLAQPSPVVIQVGVFRPEKNQIAALETIAEVREAVPDVQLVFVGDGPQRAEVERRADQLGAGEWAFFLGHRSDVGALLALADLMLLPSISDAMPMVVLESMALGVPVLATDVGDVRQVLDGAGRCVPAGDRGALRDACVELLGDRAAREVMGAAGAKRATEFDGSLMARRYEALFDAARDGDPPIAAVAGVSDDHRELPKYSR